MYINLLFSHVFSDSSSSIQIITGKSSVITNFQEYIWCSFSCKHDDIFIGCIYRSPFSEYINDLNLCDMLTEILADNFKDCITVCDFNFSSIDWKLKATIRRSIPADILADLFLEQLINKLIRIRKE